MSIETSQLKAMDISKQLAFAYLSCERVYPNYVHFSNNYNFGRPGILRTAIDVVYDGVFNKIETSKIDSLLEEVDADVPFPEHFNTFYATIAMYSGGVIYESVNLLKKTDISCIIDDVSGMCIDAVDLFIQERDDMDYTDADFEAKILNDAVMQQELSIQKGIIKYLSGIGEVSAADIDTLLKLQKEGTGTLIL